MIVASDYLEKAVLQEQERAKAKQKEKSESGEAKRRGNSKAPVNEQSPDIEVLVPSESSDSVSPDRGESPSPSRASEDKGVQKRGGSR